LIKHFYHSLNHLVFDSVKFFNNSFQQILVFIILIFDLDKILFNRIFFYLIFNQDFILIFMKLQNFYFIQYFRIFFNKNLAQLDFVILYLIVC